MIRSRCYQACVYLSLYDEDCAVEEGLQQEVEELSKVGRSSFFDPTRGWVSKSYLPYNLDQCRRTFGPSHVDDGGGIALDPSSLRCEKPLGPSRYTGDATQRSSEDSQGMDRSSSGTEGFASARNVQDGSIVGSELSPGSGSMDTCAGRSSHSYTWPGSFPPRRFPGITQAH
jgi:hypothetical protein